MVLNEDGDLESHQFMGHKDQLTLGKEAKLTPAEDKVLTMISTEKAKIKEELGLSINIFESQGYAETKKDFKKGRVRLGNLICDAMRDYGVNELNTTPPPYKISGVLSFLTSSVYRREFPIPAGHISYSDILSMLPEDTETMKIGDIDGKSLQLLFSNIRAERILSQKKSDAYSPQLPSNVRETQNFQLEIQDSKNVWSPLDPKKTYRVVFDHWLGKNGPEIQEANRIFKEKVKWIQPVKSYTVANALVEFGKLDQRSCESALNP